MNLNDFLLKFKSIWKKFAFLVVGVSLISLCFSSLLSINNELNNIQERMDEDLSTLLGETAVSVADPLWEYDLVHIQNLVTLLTYRKAVYQIQIMDKTRGLSVDDINTIYKTSDGRVHYAEKSILKNNVPIGTLKIGISSTPYLKDLYRELIARVIQSLIEITALTAVIVWISYTITKPLKALENDIEEFASGNYSKLSLIQGEDEVARLGKAFNEMAKHIEEADYELRTMNASLEQLVHERTNELNLMNIELKEALAASQEMQAELSLKNEELNNTMGELELAYKEIIEVSKSALTSQLIAGVAHEINTPIGIILTTNTFAMQEIELFKEKIDYGGLTKNDLQEFIELMMEATTNTQNNLNRTIDLIQNFKQVAVDQTSLRLREFNLKDYLDEVILTLRPAMKRIHVDIDVACPEDLMIYSYPGAYSQILTNLIFNSIKHGFKNLDSGSIRIEVNLFEQHLHLQLQLKYEDNGCGIDAALLKNIYTPFYSTAHDQGGSGLGLSIVKNLVEKTLQGQISCESELGKGIRFIIELPIELQEASSLVEHS